LAPRKVTKEAPNVLALAGPRRFLAEIYTSLRCVSKFLNVPSLQSGNALRNVRKEIEILVLTLLD